MPITVVYGPDGAPLLDQRIFAKVVAMVREHGSNIWFELPAKAFLPDGYDLSLSYAKETDIMDVWFDSGTSYTILKRNGLLAPADMYLEGGDQFRGWFNSSLITSAVAFDHPPYRQLLAHGFTLDEHGNKMSKSLGNVIDPLSVCSEYGADVLRLWVFTSDYVSDQRIGPSIIKQTGELYRKLRNSIFRFCLANLSDFDPKNDFRAATGWADQCATSLLRETAKSVTDAYERHEYIKAFNAMNHLLTTLSSWYFEVIKDTLYCDQAASQRRRQAQSVIHQVLSFYVIALAPVLVHTCEEAYGHMRKEKKRPSVHMEDWYDFTSFAAYPQAVALLGDFNRVKDEVYKKIEAARAAKLVGRSSEAAVKLCLPKRMEGGEWQDFDWQGAMNTAQVKVAYGPELAVEISRSLNAKCARCWNVFTGREMAGADLCKRCDLVVAASDNGN